MSRILACCAVLLLILGSGSYVAAATHSENATTSGACTYMGLMSLLQPNGTSVMVHHYLCENAPAETSTVNLASGEPTLAGSLLGHEVTGLSGHPLVSDSGNVNNVISWTSGKCGGADPYT